MVRRRRSLLTPAWTRLRPLARFRELLAWLRRQQGSPGYQARGLAAGVFTGCLPFFGLQIVLGVGLAGVMRGHPLLAAAGTWISNPLTTLPMCWLNLQLGILLLGPAESLPDLRRLAGLPLAELGWSFASRLLVGSVLMGLLMAPPSGWLCWWWLRRRRRQEPARPGNTIRSM
jgi:uncharacterized protein (DUF2062 family)